MCGGWVLICLTTICSRTGWWNLGDDLKGPSGNKETGCASSNKFSSLSSHLTHQRGLSYLSDIDKLHKLLSVICITINTGQTLVCNEESQCIHTPTPAIFSFSVGSVKSSIVDSAYTQKMLLLVKISNQRNFHFSLLTISNNFMNIKAQREQPRARWV